MPDDPESMEHTAHRVRIALETGDLSSFGELLDPNVRWGAPGDPSPPCQSREQVLSWYKRGKESGISATVFEVSVLGDRLLVGLLVSDNRAAEERGRTATRWQVLSVQAGRVVDIVGFDNRREAAAHAGVPAR